MHLSPLSAVFLALTVCLTGCSTFSKEELAQIRQRGVKPGVVAKLEESEPLTPPEVAELTRRGVPELLIVRQVDATGVDYLLTKDDVKVLQKAAVSPAVIDRLVVESDLFAQRNTASYDPWSVNPYDDSIYGPDPYRFTGDLTVGTGFSSYRRSSHRGHGYR